MTSVTPPHDERVEQSVLALIMETGQPYRATDVIRAEDFYTADHQTIFTALVKMDHDNGVADTNTVNMYCKSIDKAWDNWQMIRDIQTECKRRNVRSENLETFADSVRQYSLRRQYMAQAHKLADAMVTGETDNLEFYAYCDSLFKDLGKQAQAADDWFGPLREDEYNDLMDPVTMVPTGFRDLDKHTNGVCAPDLFILTGEPGSGKTTLATNIVNNLSLRGCSSACFSMEMSRNQFTKRLIAGSAGLDLKQVQQRHPSIEAQSKAAFMRHVNDQCIYIGDRGALSMGEIKAKSTQLRHETGRLDLVMIDYLGRGRPDNPSENRNAQMAQMVRDAKSIAMDLNCCVLLLAQLNREGKLRDSGEIDAEADVILHIDKDEVEQNTRVLTTKKARHAEPGQFKMTFEGNKNRFVDYAHHDGYVDDERRYY